MNFKEHFSTNGENPDLRATRMISGKETLKIYRISLQVLKEDMV